MIPFKVVIPARYASTRLAGKALLDIAGKPMIVRVCEQALASQAQQVVVATDDNRIAQAVAKLDIEVLMTNPEHTSGSARISEVATKLNWQDDVIVVNLQGDEPLIPPNYISDLAKKLSQQQTASMATLAAKLSSIEDIFNPNAVKVVLDKNDYALYFSRAPIPWDRDKFSQSKKTLSTLPYLRHIGVYAYSVKFLKSFSQWQAAPLANIESLEQLSVLWHGEKIIVQIVTKIPEAGVDTAEDLARVQAIFASKINPMH